MPNVGIGWAGALGWMAPGVNRMGAPLSAPFVLSNTSSPISLVPTTYNRMVPVLAPCTAASVSFNSTTDAPASPLPNPTG